MMKRCQMSGTSEKKKVCRDEISSNTEQKQVMELNSCDFYE